MARFISILSSIFEEKIETGINYVYMNRNEDDMAPVASALKSLFGRSYMFGLALELGTRVGPGEGGGGGAVGLRVS